MTHKIAVFLCRCGGNISGVVDFDAMQKEMEALPDVVTVVDHNLLCAPDGKKFFADVMQEHGATHAVMAACSPKDHESDFKQVLEEIGINPFMQQMANIREQCAWVTKDSEKASAKANAMMRAAVHRVTLHEALVEREIDCNPDVLVIGGGIAGISAALTAAQADRKVTLVDKSHSLGGRLPEYEEVAPNSECGPCLVAPELTDVSENGNITMVTGATVESVVGFHGNFTAKIAVEARRVDLDNCIGCDECMEACPVNVPDEFNRCLNDRTAIYIPFPGAVPNCAVIDRDACLRDKGEACDACATACPVEALVFDQADETLEVDAGSVILATGFDDFDPSGIESLGYGQLDDVYTLREFERICSGTGPHEGQIVKKNGQPPKRIAVVHCVGRSELGYCSGFCCQPALMTAPLWHMTEENCDVVHLHSDLVLTTRSGASLKESATHKGASFVRVSDPAATRVSQDGERLKLSYQAGEGIASLDADMVVLVTGATGASGMDQISESLFLTRDDNGFQAADHPVLRPSQATLDGVYLAGCVSGPMDLTESIAHAQAAAGLAISRVQPGKKMVVEVLVAQTDDATCSGCLICLAACPYHAVALDEETSLAVVNEVLCRGCGTCVATCPSGVAVARHFTDTQINAEIQEVIRG